MSVCNRFLLVHPLFRACSGPKVLMPPGLSGIPEQVNNFSIYGLLDKGIKRAFAFVRSRIHAYRKILYQSFMKAQNLLKLQHFWM